MSRREYKIDESNLPEGCILYAPLSDGDLTDHISGDSFISTGDGSYSFISDYLQITTPSQAIKTVFNITPQNWTNKIKNNFTIYAELNKVSGNCRPLMFSNIAINSEQSPQYHGNPLRSGIYVLPSYNQWYRCARVYNYSNSLFTFYINDELNYTASVTYDFTQMPSPQNLGLTLGCTGHTNYANCNFLIRNLYVFNRNLS